MADSPQRQTSLTLRLGDGADQLRLIRLDAFEALSQNFSVTLEVLSLGELELLPALGKPAAIESTVDGEHQRWFHGLVSDAEFLEAMQSSGYVYRLTLAPTAHFVEQGSNFRIFQQTSLIDIVTKVLGERSIDHEVKASGGTRILPYCVQYGESDMAFVSRLMEEEGLYYFYDHSQSGHKLIICDKPGNHDDLPGGLLVYNPLGDSQKLSDSALRNKIASHTVQSWHERASSGAEVSVAMHDYDFTKPATARKANAREKAAHELDQVEVYTWPGRYYEENTGETLSKVVLESRRAQRLRYEGTSRFPGIQVGYHAQLSEHTIGRFNRKYLVIRCRTTLANEQYRSGGTGGETFVEFSAIPNDVVYRAPLVTPRPMVQGPETAVVTGPPGEEIHVDEYGRIKIQFHWDREGTLDDKSSCWVRVSQTGGLGNIVIPRIGHEVIVDFINGNPDRPLVTGRVFNAQHMPVYKLPDNKTRALWRTKTYKRDFGDALPEALALDTKAPGANELRFEDKTGAEELFVHAERDMNTRVRHNETHHTGRDVEIKVGKNRKEWVGIDETIDIEGNRKEHVLGTETVTIEKDRKVEVHTNDSLDVTQKIKINAGQEIAISAGSKITLTVGGSSITLTPAKIEIKTVQLDMQGSATAKLAGGATVDIQAGGKAATTAALITLN